MNRFFTFFPALLLLGGGIVLVEGPNVDVDWGTFSLPWFDGVDPDGPDDVDIDPDVDDEDDDGVVEVDDCDPQDAASEYLAEVGINYMDFDYYTMGARNIDWGALKLVNTDRAFSSPLRSEAALDDFLEGDSGSSRAARRLIGDDFATVPGDWVAVQFNTPISYSGNNYWNGTRALEEGRQTAPAGDVWWLNIDSNCNVESSDVVRAACGNVGVDWIRPLVRTD